MKVRTAKKRVLQPRQKKGRAFEECVATVVRALSPGATVTQGTWIVGPDGRRDQDVLVEANIDGQLFRSLIECKDYDRSKTGPIGIGFVDALDSKRRDLSCDIALICSNAGFTEPAMRKAKRVGIVLVGVFREGDARVRYRVQEYLYFRRLKIERLGLRLDRTVGEITESCPDPVQAMLNDAPIANWVCHHMVCLISENPIGAGHFAGTFRFKEPTTFSLAAGASFTATSLFAEVTLSGGWFEQLGSIDGTAGLYDMLRRRAKVGAGPNKVHFKGLDLTKGTPVEHPPAQELDIASDTSPGEAWMQLLYLLDCNCREPVPSLENLIIPEDLDLTISGLPPVLQRPPSMESPQRGRTLFFAKNPRVGPDHSFTLTYPGTTGAA
jgi:hypothetical protein